MNEARSKIQDQHIKIKCISIFRKQLERKLRQHFHSENHQKYKILSGKVNNYVQRLCNENCGTELRESKDDLKKEC